MEPVEVEVKNKPSTSRRWVGVENVGRVQNATPTPAGSTGSTEIQISGSDDIVDDATIYGGQWNQWKWKLKINPL